MVIDIKEIILISGNSFSTLVSRVDFNYIDGEFLTCLIIHYAFDYKRLSVLDNFVDFRYIIKNHIIRTILNIMDLLNFPIEKYLLMLTKHNRMNVNIPFQSA